MDGPSVKVKCRRCGGEAPADNFKLHYEYKMMVCPNCFSSSKKPQPVKPLPLAGKEEPPKAPGWDAEDVYLEKAYRLKKESQTAVFRRIPSSSQLMCTCPGCKYTFKYDPERQYPTVCPYCNNKVPKFNQF